MTTVLILAASIGVYAGLGALTKALIDYPGGIREDLRHAVSALFTRAAAVFRSHR